MLTKRIYFILLILILAAISHVYPIEMKYPVLHGSFKGISTSKYTGTGSSMQFASEMGPRKTGGGSKVHQGLDMSPVMGYNDKYGGWISTKPYTPLFAVEEGDIIGLGFQGSDSDTSRNIWELYLRPSDASKNRDSFTWVYMHMMTTLADVDHRIKNVRNYIFIEENGDVVFGGIKVPDELTEDLASDLVDDLFNAGGILTAEEKNGWLTFLSEKDKDTGKLKNRFLAKIIKENIMHLEIDGKKVYGIALLNFRNNPHQNIGSKDNVLVFFTREAGNKFVPIVGYGKIPEIDPNIGTVNVFELNPDKFNIIENYLISGEYPLQIAKRSVQIKDHVKAGEIIGVLGDSESYSYHLHLGLTTQKKFNAAGATDWADAAYGGSKSYHRGFVHPQLGFLDADDPELKKRMTGIIRNAPNNPLPNYTLQKLGDIGLAQLDEVNNILTDNNEPIVVQKDSILPIDIFIDSRQSLDTSDSKKNKTPPGLDRVEYEITKKNILGNYVVINGDKQLYSGANKEVVRFSLVGGDVNSLPEGIKLTRDLQDQYVFPNQYSGTATGVYPINYPVDVSLRKPDPYSGSMGKERFLYNWDSSFYGEGEYIIKVIAYDFNGNERADKQRFIK